MSTAGYSGTPLPSKLGIREGSRLLLVDPPEDFGATLGELPAGVESLGEGASAVDVALLFAPDAAAVRTRFASLAASLQPAGGLWIAWPKRSSGMATDLDENVVREHALANGRVDVKVCAVDEVWSGLKHVVRLVDRTKSASPPVVPGQDRGEP